MQFTKISYTPPTPKKLPKVLVRWVDGLAEFEVSAAELPRQSFVDALAELAPDVLDLCMLDVEVERLTVRSVSLRDDAEGEAGLTITALRELDWTETPLVLNTPFASMALIPTEGIQERLLDLFDEARAFVEGKRQQLGLFEGDGLAGRVADLIPEGSGISSVTISGPGMEPATLTSETAERIRDGPGTGPMQRRDSGKSLGR